MNLAFMLSLVAFNINLVTLIGRQLRVIVICWCLVYRPGWTHTHAHIHTINICINKVYKFPFFCSYIPPPHTQAHHPRGNLLCPNSVCLARIFITRWPLWVSTSSMWGWNKSWLICSSGKTILFRRPQLLDAFIVAVGLVEGLCCISSTCAGADKLYWTVILWNVCFAILYLWAVHSVEVHILYFLTF